MANSINDTQHMVTFCRMNVVMLSVLMLNVTMPTAVMLNVLVPLQEPFFVRQASFHKQNDKFPMGL